MFDWEDIYLEIPLIQAKLEARRDADYETELRRRFPSPQPMHAVRMSGIRAVVREWLEERSDYPVEYILMICEGLWSTGAREERIAAMGIILFHEQSREMVDFRLFERWSREVDNAELVDHLAGLTGRMLEATPRLHGAVRSFALSDNPWQRRLALVTLIVASRDPSWEPGLRTMIERLENDDHPQVKQAVEWGREHLQKAEERRAQVR
jgi:3-methyladenine DNA glycosylase AlkD